MPQYNLVPLAALRSAMHAFNKSLPAQVQVIRPATHETFGSYPCRYTRMSGTEAAYVERLRNRVGWMVDLPYQQKWIPNTQYAAGSVIFPNRTTLTFVLRAENSGLTGPGPEPDWHPSGGTVDNEITWEPVALGTTMDIRGTDRLVKDGAVPLEILDIVTGQTWQFKLTIVCAALS